MEDGEATETAGIKPEKVPSHLDESGNNTIHSVTMCMHTDPCKDVYELTGSRAGAHSIYIDPGPSRYATMHENSQKFKGRR